MEFICGIVVIFTDFLFSFPLISMVVISIFLILPLFLRYPKNKYYLFLVMFALNLILPILVFFLLRSCTQITNDFFNNRIMPGTILVSGFLLAITLILYGFSVIFYLLKSSCLLKQSN